MSMRLFLFILFLPLFDVSFAQTIFVSGNARAFEYRFKISADSTSYLRVYYTKDFSLFRIYNGKLRRLNDTLYEFSYKPIVEFGTNKRAHWRQDSVTFTLRQIDTTITPLTIEVIAPNKIKQSIDINKETTQLLLIGTGKKSFTFDTKFVDPLTRKRVKMTVDPSSAPDLTFYGSTTKLAKVRIVIKANAMTIYPDYIHVEERIELKKLAKSDL